MLNNQSSYFDQIHELYPSKQGRSIKDVTFQVTEDCNLQCTYCYQHNKTHNKMTFETAKKFIDYIFESKNDQ